MIRKLVNFQKENAQDPDVFLVRVDQPADDLESMSGPVTKHRVIGIILSGIKNEYKLL